MNIDHPPLVRTKPPVEKHQAAVLAARLFNLHITDLSFVKELNSYDDRNFYMRGSLNGQRECQEYVLKIINDVESMHEYFLELQKFVQHKSLKPLQTPSLSPMHPNQLH